METQLLILIALWCGHTDSGYSINRSDIKACRNEIIKCVQNLAHGEPTSICFGVKK